MGRPPLDIAVCGAGPAGLSAAIALLRAGHRVSLFDRFERPQPVGSGLILQPTGLAVLDEFGLGQRMRRLGQRIDRMSGRLCNGQRKVLDINYAALGEARGLAVHRAALFNVLAQGLAEQGGAIRCGRRVTGVEGRMVLFEDGREGPFDLIVDALGARSPLLYHAAGPDRRSPLAYGAIWASLPWPDRPFDPHTLEQRYARASVMIGVLPIGRTSEEDKPQTAFFWSLRTRDYAAWRAAGLGPWKERVLSLWPETEPLVSAIAAPEQMTLAAYEHHTLAVPYGPHLAFIGDSAHATSPQLGQGANMALLDSATLAESLRENKDLPSALVTYARKRRFHVRLYQALSRVFTPFYQSDSAVLPAVRDLLIPALSWPAPVQRLLAGLVAGHWGLR